MSTLRLLAILAHPDDESLGIGHIFARYSAEDISTHLITATRGQRGWSDALGAYPGTVELGKIRERELHDAARVLGIDEVVLLDYMDGDLDQAAPTAIIPELTEHIRRIRPDVVVTFDHNGVYGHPDHIAICNFTHAALIAAADPLYAQQSTHAPHRVPKLYYFADAERLLDAYEELFGKLEMEIDGVKRNAVLWKEWAITTRVDCADYLDTVLDAIACHKTQVGNYEAARRDHDNALREIWSTGSFYRVYSFVNGGRTQESDLFEGLR